MSTLDDFVHKQDEAAHAENQGIARKNRVLTGQLRAMEERVGEARAEADAAVKALALFQRKYDDRPTWLTPAKGKGGDQDSGTLVAVLSDTHYGEIVRASEMNGYNAYNLDIAKQRTERFFERTIKIARRNFAGIKYDGIVLALGGDLVSGDALHDELTQTNEISTYKTVEWAIPLLAEGVSLLAKEFGAVQVVSAPGNHGRDTKVPRYKGRTDHNADTLIARIVAREMKGNGNVTFSIPDTLDATFNVYGWTFGIEHGDELAKNFSGSAEIGWIGPLIRGGNRKTNAYAAEGKKIDINIFCHGHQLLPIPARGVISNGSLIGYNEYARGRKFRPEPPQQALMVVDPRYGITLNAPVRVLDRKAEGW